MSQVLTDNVHRALKELSDHAKQQTTDGSQVFKSGHQEAIEEYDKDTLLNDSQPGDEYIYVVKATGGALVELNSASKGTDFRLASKDAQYYHVTLSDSNKGIIDEIDQDYAKSLASDAVDNEHGNDRRKLMYDQLDGILGVTGSDSLIYQKMGQEFQPNAGDKTMVRIALNTSNTVSIEVLRLQANIDADHQEKDVQQEAVYYSKVLSEETIENLKVNNMQFEVNTTQQGYANLKEISGVDFQNTLSKTRKRGMNVERERDTSSDFAM